MATGGTRPFKVRKRVCAKLNAEKISVATTMVAKVEEAIRSWFLAV